MLARMTLCMTLPTASDAVEAFDGFGADEPFELLRRRRRAQTDRAYRRLAVTILGLDVPTLADQLVNGRPALHDLDFESAA